VHKIIKYSFCLSLGILLVFSCGNSRERNYDQGANLYEEHCENCHMADGTGLEALYPPLAKADMLKNVGVGAACIIKNGLQGKIMVNGVEFETGMAPITGLSSVEITNILNYIHNAWGNEHEFIPLSQVQRTLEACE
jgi:mono/diheme cytochrome c family protein